MKILFVHHGAIAANSMNHIGPFADELIKQGNEVAVAVPDLDPSFRFFPYPKVPIISFDDLIENPNRFDNGPPDILHAWTPREIVRRFCEKLGQWVDTRWIIHLEDEESAVRDSPDLTSDDLLHRTDPLHGPWFMQQADAYTVIIDKLADGLSADKPIHTLSPGFDINAAKQNPEPKMERETFSIPKDFKIITYPGAASGANKQDLIDLYQAIHLLNQHGTPCVLIKTGFPDSILRSALPNGAENWIRDVGYLPRNQLWRLIELADILVQPGRPNSYNDGRLPSKLPDFLCLGKPIVTSSSNLGKLLRDGEHALLLKSSKPKEIAARCQELFSNNDLAKSIARGGKQFGLERFDLTRNATGLSTFYASVLGSPKNSPADPKGSQIEKALGKLELELSTIAPPSLEALKIRTYLRNLRKRDSKTKPVKIKKTPVQVELQIYYPQQPELMELGSLRRWYVPSKKNNCLLPFSTDQDMDWIRIDPGQCPGTYLLKGWSLLDANQKKLIEWQPEAENNITCQLNGATLGPVTNEGQEIWSLTHDPQILFAHLPPIDSSKIQWLSIEFEAKEVESPLTKKLKLRGKSDTLILQEEKERNDKIDSLLETLERRRSPVLRILDRLRKRYRVDQLNYSFLNAEFHTLMPLLKWLQRVFSELVPIITYQHDIKETADGIQHVIDGPRWLRPKQGEFLLRGWCFHPEKSIESVRITTSQGKQLARYGIERHDLLEAFQSQNENVLYSGFEVPLKVPRGSTKLIIEIKFHDGDWRLLTTEYLVRPRIKHFDPDFGFNENHPYTQWVKAYDTLSSSDHEEILQHIKTFKKKPFISVVVPTYNTQVKLLDQMIESVRGQLYDHWQLCIADDNSTNKNTRNRLQYWKKQDSRIQITFRDRNGHISACTNTAIELVEGEYTALLDHDDKLPPHALYYVALEINNHPSAQIIYTDEDKITTEGYRVDPYFKPDFGIDLLCSHNFVSHLGVYRSDLLRKIKGFREDFVGSQDWDVVLRCLDYIKEEDIHHIPRILYHWRLAHGSTSASVGNKDYAVSSGRRALQEYLDKYEPAGTVENGPTIGSFRIRYSIKGDPKASIIILSKNNAELLNRCVESISAKTTYSNYELIIVDNGSNEPEARALLSKLKESSSIRVFDRPVPFNYSDLNNWAAKQAEGTVLVFLNDDIEVIEKDWLRELVSHAIRPQVGPVGTKLLFPDDYIQHAGMIMGIGEMAGHAFKYLHRENPGHIGRAGIIQNYSAVTAACMAIEKKVFGELGGFDAENLATAYNDADLCLRAWDLGYRTVYTPHALLYHHESASRGLENSSEKKTRWQKEADFLKHKWRNVIEKDPFYNPALSLLTENFALANPPRYERPWETMHEGEEEESQR